jgi:GntR family transcriptional regulator
MGSRYGEIADDLRRLAAELGPGVALPRQVDLAERYEVNVKTIRRAVAVLEAEGVVRAVRRRGTIVTDGPIDWRARALVAEGRLAVMRAALDD